MGCKVMKAASDNLVPLTLELGGKSPAIVGRGHANSRTMTSIAYGKVIQWWDKHVLLQIMPLFMKKMI